MADKPALDGGPPVRPTPVLHQRAVPVVADGDPKMYCLSPESVAHRVTARTKGIVAGLQAASQRERDGLAGQAANSVPIAPTCARIRAGAERHTIAYLLTR